MDDTQRLMRMFSSYSGDNMKLITCHVPDVYIDGLKELVNKNWYPNVSEAVRAAIRELLKKELWSVRTQKA